MNFSSLLFPPRCIGCDQWLDALGSSPWICAACRGSLHFLKVPAFCPRLKKQYFEEAHAPFAFEGLVLDWIHQYKYFRKFYVLREMVSFLKQAPLDWNSYDVLVPVPLHWRRQMVRGFNPAFLLAHELGKKIEKPVCHFLKRKHSTPQQTKLPLEQRLENVAGAFDLRKNLPQNAMLLLIDDVLTTGTTANECAKALKKGGAKKVDVLTLARTL